MVGRLLMVFPGNPKAPLSAIGVPLAYRCVVPMRHPPITRDKIPVRRNAFPRPMGSSYTQLSFTSCVRSDSETCLSSFRL